MLRAWYGAFCVLVIPSVIGARPDPSDARADINTSVSVWVSNGAETDHRHCTGLRPRRHWYEGNSHTCPVNVFLFLLVGG